MAGRIDIHAHYLPDFYQEAMIAGGHEHPDGGRAIPAWSEALALEAMDRLGVQTSMISISSPGVHFGDDAKASELARAVNEEAVRLRENNPGRFGFFATLPLPDVAGSLDELKYALDVMKADGIVLESNHAGIYLGDARLEPIYAEVAQRGSVIFIHPTSPHNAEHLALGYPRPMMEFIFETTRSVTNMILSGVLERNPDARVIVPHAGAALSVLANRIELLLPLLAQEGGATPPSMRESLKKLHFDLAGAPVDELLGALLGVADHAKLHYGSDFPFTPAVAAERLLARIQGTKQLDDAFRERIYTDNSYALFPHLEPVRR